MNKIKRADREWFNSVLVKHCIEVDCQCSRIVVEKFSERLTHHLMG